MQPRWQLEAQTSHYKPLISRHYNLLHLKVIKSVTSGFLVKRTYEKQLSEMTININTDAIAILHLVVVKFHQKLVYYAGYCEIIRQGHMLSCCTSAMTGNGVLVANMTFQKCPTQYANVSTLPKKINTYLKHLWWVCIPHPVKWIRMFQLVICSEVYYWRYCTGKVTGHLQYDIFPQSPCMEHYCTCSIFQNCKVHSNLMYCGAIMENFIWLPESTLIIIYSHLMWNHLKLHVKFHQRFWCWNFKAALMFTWSMLLMSWVMGCWSMIL